MNLTLSESQSLPPQSLQRWQEVKAPHGIGYRIKLLSQLMGRQFQEYLEPHDLTPFHWLVLCCLWEQDGLATCEVGDRLRQVGGTLTGVLDRMEERGLVQRRRDLQDRRIWRIWLTEEGQKLEEILPNYATNLYEKALEGRSDAERRLLSEWIDQMIGNLS